MFDAGQPGGAVGLSSDMFRQWPEGYIVRHMVLSVLLAALIQLLVHAFTLYATLKLKRLHEGKRRALRAAATQGQELAVAI